MPSPAAAEGHSLLTVALSGAMGVEADCAGLGGPQGGQAEEWDCRALLRSSRSSEDAARRGRICRPGSIGV